MGTIFISYRREDTASEAGRLSDSLSARFGENQVFMDVDTIGFGEDFVKRLQSAVASCDVLLAIIGPRWLSVTNSDGKPRLQAPNDYVALEISAALAQDKLVIPVLINGTKMPGPGDLPASLQTFATRNKCDLSNAQWKSEVERLIAQIAKVVTPTAASGLKETAVSGLKDFATKIETFSRWQDLVVPSSVLEQLRELAEEFKNAAPLASEWRVTRPDAGTGMQVLFHGEDGTGKKLAAEIIANEFDFDLYQVDYGAVIGQQPVDTARNLDRLFELAAKRSALPTLEQWQAIQDARRDGVMEAEDDRGVMLLFEDSETLFRTKSGEANLLGLVKLRGNLIFTTTRKSELDQKLVRLCSNVIEFPFPDELARYHIWRGSIAPDVPVEDDIDFNALATKYRLTGADIRKAIFAAATVAKGEGRALTMRHLEYGATRISQSGGSGESTVVSDQ